MRGSMRRYWRREEVQESQGPMVPSSRGPKVQGPKDQDISKSHSNTSLTLKKVHLVYSTNILLKDLIQVSKLE